MSQEYSNNPPKARGVTEVSKNTKLRDSSSKIIFENPVLCAQFLKGYLNIPLFKDVRPDDIEDVSERYVHLFTEQRDSDVVKKVYIKSEKTPFYLVSLIEHKSEMDYNVIMQVFRYITFIWEDYEKEMEMQRKGISKTKDFKYPPILPILFYDGEDDWAAAASLHERVLFSNVLGEYIPNYRYLLMQLKDYSNLEFMQRSDEMSVVMMVTNLHDIAGLEKLKTEVDPEYIRNVFTGTPEYLVNIVYQVAEALLRKLGIPEEQIQEFTGQIKEVQMGELFTVLERNWRKEREELRAEGKVEGKMEGRIEGVVQTVKHMKGTIEIAAQQLTEQCGLGLEESLEKAKLYW